MTSVVDMRYTLLAPPAVLYDSGNESCASEDCLATVTLENDPYLGIDLGLSNNEIKQLEDELCKYGVTDLMKESEKLIDDMPIFPELSFDVEDISSDQELFCMDFDSVVDSMSKFDCCCSEQCRNCDSSSEWSYQSSPRSFGNWSDDDKISPLNSLDIPSPYLERRKDMECLSNKTDINNNFNYISNNGNRSFSRGKFINAIYSDNNSFGYDNNSNEYSNNNFSSNNNNYNSNCYSTDNSELYSSKTYGNGNSNIDVVNNNLWSSPVQVKNKEIVSDEPESITPSPSQTEDEEENSDCGCDYLSILKEVAQDKSKHLNAKSRKRRRLNSLSSDSDQSEDYIKEPPSRKRPNKINNRQDNEGKNGSFKPRQLYQFLMDLLRDEDYCPEYIAWVSRDDKVFRLVDSAAVARMWGECKNRENMTYEKMSRALRYYYENGILERVPNCRLHYRFGKSAYDEYASTW